MVQCRTVVIKRNYYAEDTFVSTSSVILSQNLYFIPTNVFERMTFTPSMVYRESLLVNCSYDNNNNNNNNNNDNNNTSYYVTIRSTISVGK
jgi:hypothetical protein